MYTHTRLCTGALVPGRLKKQKNRCQGGQGQKRSGMAYPPRHQSIKKTAILKYAKYITN